MSLQLSASGSDRVYRGGGWYADPQGARVAYRCYYSPDGRSDDLGVRLIRRFL